MNEKETMIFSVFGSENIISPGAPCCLYPVLEAIAFEELAVMCALAGFFGSFPFLLSF